MTNCCQDVGWGCNVGSGDRDGSMGDNRDDTNHSNNWNNSKDMGANDYKGSNGLDGANNKVYCKNSIPNNYNRVANHN